MTGETLRKASHKHNSTKHVPIHLARHCLTVLRTLILAFRWYGKANDSMAPRDHQEQFIGPG